MSKMTAAERNDLRSLIRQRARLMKTEVKQRRLALMSDFERQLSARFSYDQDKTWKGAHALAEPTSRSQETDVGSITCTVSLRLVSIPISISTNNYLG